MRDFDWQIIVTLHHTENITKTAELLFISQPALTKRIKNIEDELGLTLLIRNRQGSFFTQEGEIIAQKAEHVVSAILDAREAAFARSSGVRTSIRLGFPYSFVRYVLPDILEQFVQKNPNVDVEIVTMSSPELIRGVEDGNVDVCLARYYAEDSALERQLFSEDQACAVCNHPFQTEDLANMPFIDFIKNPGSQSALQRWWDERFPTGQNTRFIMTTSDACVSMIKRGLGFGFVLDSRYLVGEQGLYSMPLEFMDGTKLTRETWVFYRKSSTDDPVIASFLETIRKTRQDASSKADDMTKASN